MPRNRTCCRRPRAAQLVLLFISLTHFIAACPPAAAAWPLESAGRESTAVDATDPGKPVTVADLQQQQDALAERRHRVEEVLKETPSSGTSEQLREPLRMELEVLKFHELVCAQHAEEVARTGELRRELARRQEQLSALRLTGPEEPKPYSILVLDDVSDELEAARSRLHTATIELASAKEMQASAQRMFQDAETKRRQAKERLESAGNERERQAGTRQLELCELKSRLFADMRSWRRTEIGNGELDRQISELCATYLQEKHDVIAGVTVFTKEQLQTVLDELDRFEHDLRAQLPQLQSRLQELEAQSYDAAQRRQQAGEEVESGNQLESEMQLAWKTAKDNYQRQIKMIQQRLRDLVLARVEWDMRYRIYNDLATHEELTAWQSDVQAYLARMRASREMLEDQSKALMVELGRKEKQLRIARRENPALVKWIEFQIAGMHEMSQAYANHLVLVERFERLLAKLHASLTQDLVPADARDWLDIARTHLTSAWNYEITSVDDRPITVRKIVAGIILILLGFYASRRISRLIGARMLPRIGLDNGAATAIQSIAFYLLVTCFAVVSLELVNLPITVFAFLGGAVAIGVGFGSQNILNNFISGLILLTEQPIRVGDLVDIDGLCGNVEKIGARSTRVKTGANLEIIVPNSRFLENNVTNWTLSDTRMRTVVKVGVAYGSPTDQVARILKEAVGQCPHTLDEPEPIVLFNDFGDNSLNFEVHFWIIVRTMMQARKVESDLRFTIDQLMREADITIAFPQRDVHVDTLKPIEVNLRQLADESGLTVRRTDAA